MILFAGKRHFFLVFVILILINSNLFCQDTFDPASSKEEDETGLFLKATILDIRTARYDELIEWTETLGLSSRGDKKDLQKRLFDYYSVPENERTGEIEGEPAAQRTITIESARRTEYITTEDGETVVRLLGDVSLRIDDKKEGVVHSINANELVFNQEKKIITAVGAVFYVLDRGDSSEIFTGESLTFHVDTWEGVFLEGTSKRERTIEGDELTFKFSGRSISRSEQDVIVVDQGTITSSQEEPPNYRIKADTIWILGPGEWGLQNASLYVGRVPVLYFPFFFKPGDKLFFNPALGSRTREGNFIQTTTYLIGEKEEETSPFSFLQATETDDKYEQEIRGLFLTDTDIPKAAGKHTFKIMADYYTRLGAFAGVQGLFKNLGTLQTFSFLGGLGVSRNIYPQGSNYSPYWEDDNGILHSYWGKTNLLGVSLPFRYGIDTSIRFSGNSYNLLGEFELISDPFFYRDYLSRSEEMDWAKILGIDNQESPGRGTANSFIWKAEGNFKPVLKGVNPYINTLSIKKIGTSISWHSRSIPDSFLPPYIVEASDHPQEKFFYPDLLIIPDMEVSMIGTLLNLPRKIILLKQRSNKNEEENFILPWDKEEGAGEDKEKEPSFILPELPDSPKMVSFPSPPSFSLSYSLFPSVTLESRTFSSKWERPHDVDFEPKYTLLNTRNSGSLRYSYRRWLFSFSGSFQATGQFRDILYSSPDIETSELNSLLTRSYSYSSLKFSHGIKFTLKPLQSTNRFKDSLITYQLNTQLFSRSFESVTSQMTPVYSNEFLKWNDEMITNHALTADFRVGIKDYYQSLKLTAKIPPIDSSLSGILSGRTSFLTTSIATGYSETEEGWRMDPVSGTLSIYPSNNISIKGNIRYNIDENILDQSITSLSLYFADIDFVMRSVKGFSFNQDVPGWVQNPTEKFQPVSAGISFNYSLDLPPLWKNRIQIDGAVNTRTTLDFLKFTNSSLTFSFNFGITVYKFLNLSLYGQSSNQSIYRYIPSLAETVGVRWKNPLIDFFKSFNYFNINDRYESSFNIQRIGIKAVHYLGDWNLTLNYSGQPKLQTFPEGRKGYKWIRFFSVSVEWKPIPEIKREIEIQEGELEF